MGYDLHISRRNDWSDTGADISGHEWRQYVENDPELRLEPANGPFFALWQGPPGTENAWLDWSEGQIFTKDPGEPLINKMIVIAEALRATVQGDDGEVYGKDGKPIEDAIPETPPIAPAPSLRQRLAHWLGRRGRRAAEAQAAFPFAVGDTVRDAWGNLHTILAVDPRAQNGMGHVRTLRDDKTKHTFAYIAHGLTRVNPDNFK